MARLRRPSPEERRDRRRRLHETIEGSGLPIGAAIRQMREALGMTQAEFGRTLKLTARQVWELENGRANPTLETLARIGKPFGFQVGFVLPQEPDSTVSASAADS